MAIRNAVQAVKVAYSSMANLDHEELWAIFMTRSNEVISYERITSGGWDSTIIDARQVLRRALFLQSPSIILLHNHISGNPTPSASDISSTEKFRHACDMLDISLVDHIVISKGSFFSFAEEDKSEFTPSSTL